MSSERVEVSVALSLDQTVATVRFGRRTPIVASVLGVEAGSDGKLSKIWLDRDIHHSIRQKSFAFWAPSGAISTILVRMGEPARVLAEQ